MSKISYRLFLWMLFACSLFLNMNLNAENPLDNLVPDYDLEKFAETWHVSPRVKYTDGIVQQFEGMPEMFYYKTFSGPFELKSDLFPVEKNRYYEAILIFKNPGEIRPKKQGIEFYALDSKKKFAAVFAGNSEEWARLRLVFNTKDRDNVSLQIIGNSSDISLGRITLTPVKAESDRNPKVLNRIHTEKTGNVSSDFRKAGVLGNDIILQNEGKEKFYRTPVAGGEKRVFLNGSTFLMRENESLRASIRIRLKKTARVRFAVNDVLGLFNRDHDWRMELPAGKWITLVIDRSLPKRFELKRSKDIKNPETLYDDYIPCRPYLLIISKEDNTIDFDNYSMAIVPAEKKTVNLAKNKIAMNPSFETGLQGWRIRFIERPTEQAGKGRFSFEENAPEGRWSLKIEKGIDKINRRHNIVRLSMLLNDLPIQKKYTLSFWAKSNRPTLLSLKFSRVRGIKRWKLTPEWKRYSHTFFLPYRNGWGYSDLQFESPLDGSTFWFDGVQLEEGEKATDFESPESFEIGCELPRNKFQIYFADEKRIAQLKIRSSKKTTSKCEAVIELKDYKNRTVKTLKRTVELKPGSSFCEALELDPGKFGWFHIHAKLNDPVGKQLAESYSAFAVIPKPDKIAKEDSFIGMQVCPVHYDRIGVTENYQITSGYSLDDEFSAYAKCGIRWVRLQPLSAWWNSEPVRGANEWAKWDFTTDVAKRHDIGILADFMSQKHAPWSLPEGKFIKGKYQVSNLEDVKAYAERWSKHFADRVQIVQLMNETGGYKAEDFFEVAKTITPIFRKNAPNIKLMYPSYPGVAFPPTEGGFGNDWIGTLFKKGITKLCDYHDMHIYLMGMATSKTRMANKHPFDVRKVSAYGTLPETIEQRIKVFRKDVDANIPIINSETGTIDIVNAPWLFFPPLDKTYWYTREVSLGRSVRFSILQMALGFKREFYFMFVGLQWERHGLDLFCNDLTPTASLPARAVFAKMLDGSKFFKKARIGESTWVCIFTKNGKTVAAYWDGSLENKPAGTLSGIAAKGKAFDVMGNEIEYTGSTLPLESTPCYFITEESPEKVIQQFQKAKITGISETVIKNYLTTAGKFVVSVKNVSSESSPAAKLRLKTSGPVTLSQRVLQVPELAAGKKVEIPVTPAFKESSDMFSIQAILPSGLASNILRMPTAFFYKGAKYSKPSVSLSISGGKVSPAFADCGNVPKIHFSGDFYGWYTDKALHLYSTIRDRSISPAPANAPIHTGDNIEYFFDFSTETTSEAEDYSADGFRLILAPSDPVRVEMDRNWSAVRITNSFLDLDAMRNILHKRDDGYSIETVIPLKKQLFPGMLFRFGVQFLQKDKEGGCGINWTYRRAFRDVSRIGLAVCR